MTTPTPDRARDARWLLELTSIPTAAGREDGVIRWIERYVNERPELCLARDSAGNLVVSRADAPKDKPPVFITAHLDHPAFVVEEFLKGNRLRLTFRGSVLDPYFNGAAITVHPDDAPAARARVLDATEAKPLREVTAELIDHASPQDARLSVGDVARWDFPDATIDDKGIVKTHACDDLAAAAAALAAMDVLRATPGAAHVQLLFTRAEEVGFIGAIAVCKLKTIPEGSRLVCLENSRSFPESPIGAGPIVRVGDKISVFSPTLTAAVAKTCDTLEKDRAETDDPFRWQRKLMPGGACEATAFQSYGYESTCVCLPLGNYHNMADLQGIQDNDKAAIAHACAGQEYIALADYQGLIDLLIALGTQLEHAPPIVERMEILYAERAFVLDS